MPKEHHLGCVVLYCVINCRATVQDIKREKSEGMSAFVLEGERESE